MIHLLAVDDESLNLRIIKESLEDNGYSITLCGSGEEAWSTLQNTNLNYSTVILDRLMPGMDGIELLKKIKSDSSLQDIPVILQTALGSTDHVIEGMGAGAFYYLTKPYSKKLLTSIVNLAVENYSRFTIAKEELNKSKSFSDYFSKGEFKIKNFDDVLKISPVISNLFPNPKKSLSGIIELLFNAIEHGNLGIGFEEKKELLETKKYEMEIKSRLTSPSYKDKEVKILVLRTNSFTEMTITDDGEGFDFESFLDINSMKNNLFHTTGRGILIAKSVSFDSVDYIGKGNEVKVTSYIKV